MESPKCDRCPLSKHCSRTPANHYGTSVAVVIDQVDRSGESSGYLMNGQDADDLQSALRKLGMKRNHVSYVPVIRGQYPGMSRKKYRGQWERATGKKWGVDVPSPEECCEPWFRDQLSRYENVIALGPLAGKAVLRGNTGFDKTRGTPVTEDMSRYGHKVMLTWAGWMLRSEPKFKEYFRSDISKAFRFFRGELEAVSPLLIEVTPENWRERLEQLVDECQVRGEVYWDIESAPYAHQMNAKGDVRPRYNTLLNPLIVLGMGWSSHAYVANFVDHDWPEKDREGFIRGYGTILEDKCVTKWGWNSIGYDALNMLAQHGIETRNHRDGMILARVVAPELPKSLAFWAAALTDVCGWKDGADYTDSKYNAMDCAVTAIVCGKLAEMVKKSPQRHAYAKIAKFQVALNRMCRVGVPINESKRAELEEKYTDIRDTHLRAMRGFAGEDFNPRSTKDVERLFYDTWGLPVPGWTNSGAPACDKDAVIELLGSSVLSEDQRFFLDAFRRYKLSSTLLSSYLIPWRASGPLVREGRIYPGMSASGTVGARPSSSNPNMLVTPRVLGDVVCPPEGYALIETDLSAAEFIYVIMAAKIEPLQEAFERGADLHGVVLEFLAKLDPSGRLLEALRALEGYPEGGPWSGNKGTGEYSARRQLQKNFNFASLYAAKAAAKRGILRKDMNRDWDLNNVGLTMAQVTAMDVAFHRAFPELGRWWGDLARQYRAQGFVRDDNWGLVRFMPNGYKPTEPPNFKAQSTTAGYVNDAILSLIDDEILRPRPQEGTGLFLTVYDSIKAVVPVGDVDSAASRMHAAMTVNDTRTGLRIKAETEVKYPCGRVESWGAPK